MIVSINKSAEPTAFLTKAEAYKMNLAVSLIVTHNDTSNTSLSTVVGLPLRNLNRVNYSSFT